MMTAPLLVRTLSQVTSQKELTQETMSQGAFNFSEYSQQDVQSTISDQAVVHGDSSANVAGNQYNCLRRFLYSWRQQWCPDKI